MSGSASFQRVRKGPFTIDLSAEHPAARNLGILILRFSCCVGSRKLQIEGVDFLSADGAHEDRGIVGS